MEQRLAPNGTCHECRESLEGRNKHALWCSDTCRKRHARRFESVTTLRDGYSPETLDEFDSLDEIPADFSLNQHQEAGDSPWPDYEDEPYSRINDAFALESLLQEIRDHYDALMEPYEATARRNRGVVLPEVAALTRRRDAEIKSVLDAHYKAEAYDLAVRNQPADILSARERADGQRALTAFGSQLSGRRVRAAYIPQAYAGRSTSDLIRWG